jgi:hypothetical protein
VKYARCAKCKDFYLENRLAVYECPSCMFCTYRCKKCGGEQGTHRSVRMHFSWYRARANGVGGHEGQVAVGVQKVSRIRRAA